MLIHLLEDISRPSDPTPIRYGKENSLGSDGTECSFQNVNTLDDNQIDQTYLGNDRIESGGYLYRNGSQLLKMFKLAIDYKDSSLHVLIMKLKDGGKMAFKYLSISGIVEELINRPVLEFPNNNVPNTIAYGKRIFRSFNLLQALIEPYGTLEPDRNFNQGRTVNLRSTRNKEFEIFISHNFSCNLRLEPDRSSWQSKSIPITYPQQNCAISQTTTSTTMEQVEEIIPHLQSCASGKEQAVIGKYSNKEGRTCASSDSDDQVEIRLQEYGEDCCSDPIESDLDSNEEQLNDTDEIHAVSDFFRCVLVFVTLIINPYVEGFIRPQRSNNTRELVHLCHVNIIFHFILLCF